MEVQALTGATGTEFEALSNQAKELGKTTMFSATQSANAMSELASAGFTTTEIMSAMPGLLDLAASGNIGLAEAANIASSTLRGFGLEASQSSHVSDVLAEAAARTNAGITDMGMAMGYIAPVASAMGVSIEETAAAVGLLSNAGIQGSKAGTVLRSALSSLAKPSKEASELMANLGFNAYDTNGKMIPLNKIIANLQKSMSGLTDKQKQNALVTIFGQEALSGMLALIAAGPDELNNLTNGFENCDGSAKKMADTMQNNLQGKVTQFKSALEGAGIAIGENLIPSLTKIVVQGFGKLDSSTQSMIVNFGLMAIAAGPVISFIGKLTTGIGSLVSGISAAVSGVGGFGSILGAVMSPAGAIFAAVTGVGLLTAGFITLQNEMDANESKLERAGTYFEDFSGRVRTNRSMWTKLFGEDIEIKFSSNFEEEKNTIEQGYQDLATAWQEYYNTKSGMNDEESKRRLTELTADNEEQKTILREHLDDNLQLLSDYFMETGYMNSQQVAEQETLYADFYHAQEQIFSDNQSKILEIQQNAYNQKRELTTKEQEEINALVEQNSAIMAALTTSNVEDMLSAYKAYSETTTKLIQADAEQKQLYVENIQGAYDKLTQTVHQSFAEQEEAIRNNTALTKEQQDVMIAGLQLQEQAITDFTSSYGNMVQENMNQGYSLAEANGMAMAQIVADLQSGKINAEEFGMTNAQYMAMAIDAMINAGASADDLTAAIGAIPKEKRAEVLANVKGKDKVDGLKASIDSVQSKSVTITATAVMRGDVTQNAPGGGKWTLATGTENANSGLTEVAEYGPELIMSRSGASAYLATERQLFNMEGGERVFNARQTSEILRSAAERNSTKNNSNIEKLLNEAITRLDRIKDATNNNSIEVTKAIENKELVSNVNLDSNSLAKGITPSVEKEQGNRMLLYKRGVLV